MSSLPVPPMGLLCNARDSMPLTAAPVAAPARGRIAGLDALRGLAAAAVVLFHYTQRYQDIYGHTSHVPGFDLGHHGVLLFFIISGFVILMTVERAKTTGRFIQSRFARLYPAFWVSVVLTFLVVSWMGLPGRAVGIKAMVLNLTMFPQLLGARSVDSVYWTLLIELMFYGIMVALLMTGTVRHATMVMGAIVIAATVDVLFFKNKQFPIIGPARNFASTAYCFLIGTMLYRAWQNPARLRVTAAVIVGCCAYAALAEGWMVAFLTASFSAIVYIATTRRIPLLQSAPLVFLGTISYTLYLLHQNIGYAVIRRLSQLGVNSYLAIAAAIVLSVGLAALVSFVIERPANEALRARTPRKVIKPVEAPTPAGALAEGLVPA